MKIKYLKLVALVWIIVFAISCNSVKKYNAQIAKKHTPEELKEDLDYAYNKLKKLHPNLYQYISKENLEANFSNLKKKLTSPLSSIDFYKKMSPVIATIGQGHTSLSSPHKRQTKKEKKEKGKQKALFKNFQFETLNNKIYVNKAFGKDSLITRGTELIKINDENINELANFYETLGTGDGYIKTFMPKIARIRIGHYYYLTNTIKDSVTITLKVKDSVFTRTLYAYKKKDKKKDSLNDVGKKKDSLKIAEKKITKSEKKKAKAKRKAKYEWNQKHGYDKFTKQSKRNFEFLKTQNKDSVAYLKIRGFSKGDYEDFYDAIFKRIDSTKVDNLIIDLRNNTGGRLSEIAYLYSYLTDKKHQFIMPSKMTKANSFMYPFTHYGSLLKKIIIFPIGKIIQLFNVKKIDGQPHFIFKGAKMQEPKLEHNYKGKIYVLINAISFSASSVLSNKLQATERAFFVGEETGGAYNSTVAGIFTPIELPNSKEVLRIGLMVLETPHKTTPDGYGIKPNKYIKTTTFSKDEQLDWVLEDILKKKEALKIKTLKK